MQHALARALRAPWTWLPLPFVLALLAGGLAAAGTRTSAHGETKAALVDEPHRVQRDGTVRVDGVAYEVEAPLVGEVVSVRFDASRPGVPVEIWHHGRRFGHARRVHVAEAPRGGE